MHFLQSKTNQAGYGHYPRIDGLDIQAGEQITAVIPVRFHDAPVERTILLGSVIDSPSGEETSGTGYLTIYKREVDGVKKFSIAATSWTAQWDEWTNKNSPRTVATPGKPDELTYGTEFNAGEWHVLVVQGLAKTKGLLLGSGHKSRYGIEADFGEGMMIIKGSVKDEVIDKYVKNIKNNVLPQK